MTLRRTLTAALLCTALLCAAACAGKPVGAPETEANPSDAVWIPEEKSMSSLDEVDGVLYVRIPDTTAADLSPLAGEGFPGRLHAEMPPSLKTLILPQGTVTASLEPATGDRFLLDLLDASAAETLVQLNLAGEVKSARLPESLSDLILWGGATDLSPLRDCPNLSSLTLLHPTDLSPLPDTAVGILSLFRASEDGPWDLTPLVAMSLTVLRLNAGITAEEAAGLAGASVHILQVSDRSVNDLSFLASMPDTETLLLDVSGEQPPEILSAMTDGPCPRELLPLLNTPIPREQLASFPGQIVLVEGIGR